jgi:hypothetical protein
MDYEYNACIVFTAYGAEIKLNIPYLDVEPTESLLREMLVEDFFQNMEIKSFDYVKEPII